MEAIIEKPHVSLDELYEHFGQEIYWCRQGRMVRKAKRIEKRLLRTRLKEDLRKLKSQHPLALFLCLANRQGFCILSSTTAFKNLKTLNHGKYRRHRKRAEAPYTWT